MAECSETEENQFKAYLNLNYIENFTFYLTVNNQGFHCFSKICQEIQVSLMTGTFNEWLCKRILIKVSDPVADSVWPRGWIEV